MLPSVLSAGRFAGVIGTFMGRDAIALATQVLDLAPGDTVLLPAYLCNEVVKPFLGKCRVEFYALQPGLTIDPDAVRRRLAASPVKAFVMINYFGFLDPQRQAIKRICTERGTTLVEDCALSLLTEGSGETGDLAVYSFRKTLPVRDGGGLRVNDGRPQPSPDFRPRIVSDVLSLCIWGKQTFQIRTERLSRAGLSTPPATQPAATGEAPRPTRVLPMSSFTRRGVQRASYGDIVERQRKDFLFWLEWTNRTGRCRPIYDSLPPGVCPLGFPVKIENRDEIRRRLQERGVFLRVHWRMPAAVGPEFRDSHALSAETITLPVYPELGDKERTEIQQVLTAG